MDFVGDSDAAEIANKDLLSRVSGLLSCDPQEAEKTLCSRVVAARGEVMEKGHTIEQAQYGRDSFAKVCFTSLIVCFLFLVLWKW